MRVDPITFKAIMVLVGSSVSAIVAAYYFLSTEKNYLREGMLLAVTWLAVNWVLDFVALIPFSGQTIPQYFSEIGIEYVGLVAPVIAIGYVMGKKLDMYGHKL